ncbi:MAG: hypothetical protein CMF38_01035 [Legionellaceae bacterium]|mgnify:CR=1 FL=1|nr:hypothetical protein [Legionellaceae bacterium]HCA88758.1 hypothetical protein [Legionellales bacterium]|tara:strand:+ start:1888 stop:2205 length:318 start_codon:yes stop_codon:yes gene_type:complete
MKHYTKWLPVLCLSLSSVAMADKIMVKGEPVMLDKQGDVYMVPAGYQSTTDYHFVSLDGQKRVCFGDKRAELSNVDEMTVQVSMDGKVMPWHCYAFDDSVFEMSK